jgi:hypothetical protein
LVICQHLQVARRKYHEQKQTRTFNQHVTFVSWRQTNNKQWHNKNFTTKLDKKTTNNNKIDDTLNKKGHCF